MAYPRDTFIGSVYVDTKQDAEHLKRVVSANLSDTGASKSIEAEVGKNDSFVAASERRMPYDFITEARFCVDLYATGLVADFSEQDTRDAVSELIVKIRDIPNTIAAIACDYEDEVALKTGWNWSATTPNPPGLLT